MPVSLTDGTPRLPDIAAPDAAARGVVGVVDAPRGIAGEGFQVRHAFAGIDLRYVDPFLMLDHLGAVDLAPGEAKGAPDHPHRGFETVTYLVDGELEHRDSTGGGGLITPGGTQWMTAGAGIVHSELPSDPFTRRGGVLHGAQLWVNLPKAQKWSAPAYQDIDADRVEVIASSDGAAMVRLIAGDVAGFRGPGSTRTPITYLHASLPPGARLRLPWRSDFNAIAYAMAGSGTLGPESVPLREGQSAVHDLDGDSLLLRADTASRGAASGFEVLVMGGAPIREPIAWYGPFVMNTRADIVQAVEDYQAGRMGRIPAARA